MILRFTNLFILALLFAAQSASAQFNKNVVVEHFTNTRCSICSSPAKNPAFFTNLEAHPEVIHISYHPSSPYANCELSLHNPAENDGRTKYYDIYGGTPRLMVQGVLNPNNVAFGSTDVFTQYLNNSTEVTIDIEQTKVSDQSIEAKVTITTESMHNYINPKLMVGVAEKLVTYAAPNGEPEHHNVFRKAMTDITGDVITLPALGESITLTFSVDHNADWDFSQMFAYAILNDGTSKQVIQAAAAAPSDNTVSSIKENTLTDLAVYPNPVNNELNIDLESNHQSTAQLFDVHGKLLMTETFLSKTQLDLSQLSKGLYFLEIKNEEGTAVEKVMKVKM